MTTQMKSIYENRGADDINNIATQDLLSDADIIENSDNEDDGQEFDYVEEDLDDDGYYPDEYIPAPQPTKQTDEFYCIENANLFRNKPVQTSKRLAQTQPTLHKGVISSCDFSLWDQGNHVITAGWDSRVHFFDLQQHYGVDQSDETTITTITAPLRELEGHEGIVNDVRSANSTPMIVSSGQDGTARLWDVRSGAASINVLKGHNNESVSAAVFTNNDRFVVSGSEDGLLKIWDVRNLGKSVKGVHLHSGINDISISDYHSRISVALNKRQCKIFDLSGTCLNTYQKSGHDLMVTGTAWSNDGLSVYTSSIDRQIIQWQFETNMEYNEK
ncbi:WD repeat-containing protein [Acrasis kona]|uniref:WD repeat-containing protein n=1 Tax=Acrasis kona TaxID=1008807 RepID=A0AAW2ZBU0_9EUKA